jgi:TRAP-type C4-dicarboxylate transport system substrate-binding protein
LAIKRQQNMKGLKIRVVGSPLFLDTFTALGANPTQLCRRATALATGAVDGQEKRCRSSPPLAAQLGAKHITMWGYVNDPLILSSTETSGCPGPKADRAIVRQAAIDAGKQEVVIAGLSEADPLLRKSLPWV